MELNFYWPELTALIPVLCINYKKHRHQNKIHVYWFFIYFILATPTFLLGIFWVLSECIFLRVWATEYHVTNSCNKQTHKPSTWKLKLCINSIWIHKIQICQYVPNWHIFPCFSVKPKSWQISLEKTMESDEGFFTGQITWFHFVNAVVSSWVSSHCIASPFTLLRTRVDYDTHSLSLVTQINRGLT